MEISQTEMSSVENKLLALLCDSAESWTWGGDTDHWSFERNGEGTLLLAENQRALIAIEFNWSLSNQTVRPVVTHDGSWEFTIIMKFSTRLHPSYHSRNPWMTEFELNEHLKHPPSPSEAPFPWAPFQSTAFQPKQYTLRLSCGRFIEPFHYFIRRPYPIFQSVSYRFAPNRYIHQLSFCDRPPYPPREEWVKEGSMRVGSLDYQQFWKRRNFVRGYIAKSEETWGETLDLGWWFSPIIGDAHARNP